ncbi:MAG: EAL domain-containing protein [Terriglobales bacterium]
MTLTLNGLDLRAVAALIATSRDFVAVYDREFRCILGNPALASAIGRDVGDLPGKTLAEMGYPPHLCVRLNAAMQAVRDTAQSGELEYEAPLVGGTRVMHSLMNPVLGADGAVIAFLVITRDTTPHRRAAALSDSQAEIMRRIVAGATLPQMMETMVRLAEENTPGRACSILLLAPDGRHLIPGHAPHLPADLIRSICARAIATDNACCGIAAVTRRTAITSDIASDPAWAAHRDAALKHNLRACWSEPILAADGELLGTFAMYHRRARVPYERELDVVRAAAMMAALSIQSCRARDLLLDAEERFSALTENAANIVSVLDTHLVRRYVSPAVGTLLGFAPEHFIGQPAALGLHPDDVQGALRDFGRLSSEVGAQVSVRCRHAHQDGSWRVLESIARSRRDRHGEVIIVLSSRDVTEREETLQSLRDSEAQLAAALTVSRRSAERLDRALSASRLGMWDWDLEKFGLFVDPYFAGIMGYTVEEMLPRADWFLPRIHPDDRQRVYDAFVAQLKGKSAYLEVEFRGRTKSGEWKWILARGQVTARRKDGRALHMAGTNRDIDEEKRLRSQLDRSQTHVQLLLDATEEGIVGLDDVGTCSFVNPAALTMLGCATDQLLGRDFADVVRHTRESGEELLGHDSPIHRCLTEGKRYRSASDDQFRCGDRVFPVEMSVSPIVMGKSNTGAVVAFHDVSEKRALAHQLRHQALHDPLTGLMNRRGFEARLNELLASARSENRRHALCYLDLDQFKVVNDTCGHVAGDELLRQLPAVFTPCLRERDVVVRLGGDEFAVLLEDCPLEAASGIAQKLRDVVRDFRFVWQQRSFAVGASIGVVGITADNQGPVSVLGAADSACYVAKEQGPNHVHVSYPHDLAIIRRRGEMRWVARLRHAIEENHFRLHYQSIAALNAPETATHGASPTSHELLIRLADAKEGLILPGAFLPAAERYHLIYAVDQWVVDNAMRYLGQALRSHPELAHHHFGINLSGDSLHEEGLLSHIEQAFSRHGVPPGMIYFEVTETAAISNLSAASEVMRGIKRLGCRLALDDFGSGMSSFSYLKNLPVDYLKIDGSFIRDIVKNPVDQAIVRAAQAVGRALGIATVAEFVETTEILELLRGMGVGFAQGYAIARPAPLESFPLLQPAAATVTAPSKQDGR